MSQESFTQAELRELARTIKSPTGRRLLWEVSRLRAIVRQAAQLERSVSAGPDSIDAAAIGIAAEELRKMLDRLPWLADEPTSGKKRPRSR